jgi:hypothetical protein
MAILHGRYAGVVVEAGNRLRIRPQLYFENPSPHRFPTICTVIPCSLINPVNPYFFPQCRSTITKYTLNLTTQLITQAVILPVGAEIPPPK